MSEIKKCPICKAKVIGRSDKRFCSASCKSNYNQRLSKHTKAETIKIDKILHRNHSILVELMGKNSQQKKMAVFELEKRKFNFNYITKYIINSKGKIYHYVYNFSWMTFSDNEVLIIKR